MCAREKRYWMEYIKPDGTKDVAFRSYPKPYWSVMGHVTDLLSMGRIVQVWIREEDKRYSMD